MGSEDPPLLTLDPLCQRVVHPVGSEDPLTDVTPLSLTFDSTFDCSCALRQRIVHPEGSEDPPY